MSLWKTLTLATMMLVGSQVKADGNFTPVDKMTMFTVLGPSTLTAWSSSLSEDSQKPLASGKADALAFIGSDGEIRGALFEQASRHYRSAYTSPVMSDMQLAQAIATAY